MADQRDSEVLLPVEHILDRWRRRYWTPGAVEKFAGLAPATVVTGASEGIGLALAQEFVAAGNALVLVARNADALAVAATALSALGAKVHIVAADLAPAAGCAAVETFLAANNLYADILINNAGMGLGGPFSQQPPERVLALLDLNMRALTDLTRRFLPGMLARGRGGVLNVASLGGLAPTPNQAVYYASKAYVISFTEALASECAGQGVRISALVPGPVATKFHARMGTEHSYFLSLIGVMSPRNVARAGWRGFRWGQVLIYPGVFNRMAGLALRLAPHWISVPVLGWMLRQRET